MAQDISTKQEYQGLREEEIIKALEKGYDNDVAVEVRRLVAGYTRIFQARISRCGGIPRNLGRISSRFAIERVSSQIAIGEVRASYR